MSKIREQVPTPRDELPPAEGDLRAYAVFTQLKVDGPYEYAGWLDAVDDRMALTFAREHYGQDQQCTSIWCVPGGVITATEARYDGRDEGEPTRRAYRVFICTSPVSGPVSDATLEAATGREALERAMHEIDGAAEAENVWVAPDDMIAATSEGDLIWRLTDQTYRLARGYAKDVREKWQALRTKRDLETYEKDDLKETF